jgi:hypothetical protein
MARYGGRFYSVEGVMNFNLGNINVSALVSIERKNK